MKETWYKIFLNNLLCDVGPRKHQNIKHFWAVDFCVHDCQIYRLDKTSLLLIGKMLISFWVLLVKFYSHSFFSFKKTIW